MKKEIMLCLCACAVVRSRPAAIGVQVEDPHAVREAEPGLRAAVRTGAVPIQGAQHQPLTGLGQRHECQRLLGIFWGEAAGKEKSGKMGIECDHIFLFVWFLFVSPALTCLEEVPLGTILSVVLLLWGEEEPHGSHLTHTHTWIRLSSFTLPLNIAAPHDRSGRLVHVANNRWQHLPDPPWAEPDPRGPTGRSARCQTSAARSSWQNLSPARSTKEEKRTHWAASREGSAEAVGAGLS